MQLLARAALVWGFAAAALAYGPYGEDALQDELHDLPGAPAVPWRMFSGYIDVSADKEPAGTRKMFYWFVESQGSPSKDPVILWTNGGPGCSGMGGFLSEQGPFRAGVGGHALELNEFAWNKAANMVFIEQPVGVGFSSTSVDIEYGDVQAAADNYRFAVGFFKRFPLYNSHEFYISSESYGGHYMPTLAKTLKEGGGVPQFRGVFLGNPLTFMMYRNYGQYGTAWGHQLLPLPLWKAYEAGQCASTFPPSDVCSNVTAQMDSILSGFDPYALDFPTCASDVAAGRHERWTLRQTIQRAQSATQPSKPPTFHAEGPYQPCIDDFMTAYLNRADVQAAIHVAPGAKWGMCSDDVGAAYNITDVNAPMMPIWDWLIQQGDLKIMIYSGDDDAICATLGTQQFIWDLGYPPEESTSWSPWKVQGQVAGFRTDFVVPSSNGGSFSFVTVHGAGHMVPATQPARSLALLQDFLGAAHFGDKTLMVL